MRVLVLVPCLLAAAPAALAQTETSTTETTTHTTTSGDGAASGPLPKLAVLDVSVKNVDHETGDIFTEVLTAEVAGLGLHEVMSGSEINAIIGFEAQKELLSCDDSACMAELGGALGADMIVISQVGKVGETFVVSIKLVDTKEVKAHKRIYETVEGRVDAVLAVIRSGVARLFGVERPHSEATVIEKPPHQHDEHGEEHAHAGEGATEPAPVVEKAQGRGFPVLPVVLMGAGAVGVGIGAYFGVEAANKESLAKSRGPGSQVAIDQAKGSALIANVLYGVGGAVAAGGVVWLIVSLMSGGESAEEVAAYPMIGPDFVGAAASIRGW